MPGQTIKGTTHRCRGVPVGVRVSALDGSRPIVRVSEIVANRPDILAAIPTYSKEELAQLVKASPTLPR